MDANRTRLEETGGASRALALIVATLTLLGCGSSPTGDEAPAGVLLITVDTLRADHLGCYGAPGDATPNIDRLASEGVLFLDAMTPVPVTLPAHASLMTATPPPVHGVRDNGIFRLGDSRPTLAERLRDGGFTGAAFVGAVVLDAAYGLGRGFAHYDDEIHVSARSEGGGISSFADRPAAEVVDAALAWLGERPKDSRFFAWVHLFDPHIPYRPPPSEGGRFEATYAGEVAYADREIGRLLDGLEDLGRAKETVVVLTSDHGEGLGEHGEMTHGYFLYQSTVHVPLVLRFPGRLPAGRRVEGPVSLMDIGPTLLDLLKLAPLSDVEGLSLVEAARGGSLPQRPFYLETYLPYFEMLWSGSRGVRDGERKYLFSSEAELYDLSVDPREGRDLASERPEIVARMDETLQSLARRLEDGTVEDAGQPRLDQEDEARLRSLGYLSGGAGITTDLSARAVRRPDTRQRIRMIDTLIEVAPAAIDRGDPEALVRLEELSRQDPENPRLQSLLGKALIRQGRLADAIAVLRRAIELDPEDPRLHGNLAAALLRAGDSGEAGVAIDRALALDSSDPEVRRLYGRLLIKRDPEQAEAIFRGLLGGNPADMAALRGLGQALAARNRWPEVLEAANRLLEVEPDSVDDLVLAGMAAVRLERFGEAEERFGRALEFSPDHLGALLGMGLALASRGDDRQSAAVFERAMKLAPDNPLALSSYARAAARVGDVASARRALERSLALNPEQPAARDLLRQLGP